MQKKYIIIVLAMLGFALEGSAKSINTYGLNIGAGQTREFYIYMNTTRNNLVSFQIDLKVPQGITVNMDRCGLPSRVIDKEQSLFVGQVADNLYRLVSTSYNLTPFTKDDAPLVRVSITADETFKGGSVELVDMFTINSEGTKVIWISDSFDVAKVDVIRGDVNCDGVVTVTDVGDLVKHILGEDDLLFNSSYDLDNNGMVDVADVTLLSDILLGNAR